MAPDNELYGAAKNRFKSMHWSDEAIVLSIKKHGESSAVMRVLAKTHGVYGGVVKGASSKSNRGILQSGNVVSVNWNARLSEHIGTFKAELLEPVAAYLMSDALKLSALSSACALIESAMPERHPYAKLYGEFRDLLERVKEADDWLTDYVRFELSVLAESGFGLDLSRCAATGTTENLMYVSPKSGRAVSREAGEPYKEKMLKLPEFLITPSAQAEEVSILDGLTLTGYFLEHWLLEPHRRRLPAARQRLIQTLQQTLYKPAEIL
jgi:DNA repair protein RecO (recombination protein O)